MLATSSPDRIHIAFDDDRLVDHAGLLLPATLAGRLGLRELADAHLDLGDAAGRANVGDKLMTLIASALAGGDCIDDAAAMRSGGAGRVLGCTVKAPSTLGTFLRSFSWGHVRQLDRLSRELLARSWAAGAGPGAAPFTIDLDSTICETYGLAKTPQDAKGSSSEVLVDVTVSSLKKREEKLVRLFSYDDVDDEVVRRELQGLQRQRTTLTDELESLPRPGASLPAGVDEAALRRICEAVAERLDGGGPEDQERVGKRRPGP